MKLFGLILALTVLHVAAIYSFSFTNSAMKSAPHDEILKVEIQAVTDRYRNAAERKKFPWYYPGIDSNPNYHIIEFQVRNITNQEQAFRIMNCSYGQHWAVDSKKVLLSGSWLCGGNAAILMTLKPGESYSSLLPVTLAGVAEGEVVEFRMSFTPYRKERNKRWYEPLGTYWSNVLKIKRAEL
jgi:hypothetical protein